MKIIKGYLASLAFWLGLFGTLLFSGMVVYAQEDTNSFSSVNMTVPSEINVVMNADGSNSISEFYVQNDMLIPARINDMSVSGNNGWNLVSKDTEIHANKKSISLSVQGYDLKEGSNTVDIAVPEEKRTNLSINIKRGAFTSPINENAFSIEIGYSLETKDFTVNFNGNGYGGNVSSITAKNGSTVLLPTISRPGYAFDGWKNTSGVVYKGGSSYVMPIGNHTLTAQWTPINYSISFNTNGGSLSGTIPSSYNIESADVVLPTPSKNGYTFGGWYDNSGLSGSAVTKISKGSTGNRSFYAKWNPNTYTITYNDNGGTGGPGSQSFKFNSGEKFSSVKPSRVGYTFSGWSHGDNLYQPGDSIPSGYGSFTVTAKWVANTYTVTFNGNGGTPSTGTKEVTYDSTYGTLPQPNRNGYTFKGWFTAASGGSQVSSTTKVAITSNQTLYAQWTLNTYTITYNLNGGTNSSSNPSSYNITSASITLANPSRTGYTFGGWYSESTFVNKVTSIPQGSYGDKVLYAKWVANTYTIAFNGNANTSGATASKSMTYGSAGTLTSNGFVKAGYTFAGWNSNAYGTGTAYTNGQSVSNLTATNGATVTLYAQWTPNTLKATMNVNGGTGGAWSSLSDNIGRLSVPGTPSKTGYTFSKWSLQSGADGYLGNAVFSDPLGTISAYDNNQTGYTTAVKDTSVTTSYGSYSYKITHNGTGQSPGYGGFYRTTTSKANGKFVHTFYAKLPKGTMITQAANSIGSGGTFNWITSKYGTGDWEWYAYEINCGSSGTFSTFGYIYLSSLTAPTSSSPITWYVGYNQIVDVTNGYGNTYVFGSTSDTLTANYTVNNYTLTYNANGGSVSTASKLVAYGSQYGSLPTPTRTGYTFNGWFTAASGGSQVSSTTTMGAGNTTIYAQWSANTYTVKYDGNGATEGTTASSSHTYGVAKALTSNGFTRTGYTFAGWATSASGSVVYSNSQSVSNLSTVHGGIVNLYAKWTINSYILTFNANGGSVSATSKSVTYGSQYGSLPTPTRTGYTFKGWFTAASGGSQVTSTTTMGAANATIYAQWTPNTYTVSYNGNGATGGSTASSSHTYGTAKALTSNGFSRTGYTFLGWSTSSSASTATYTNGQSVSNLTSTNGGTVTLYAVWKVNSYTLTFNANGGSVSPTSRSVNYGAQYGSLPTPTRTGYTFNGWFTAASGGSQVSSTTTMGAGNTTVYAHWTLNTITFKITPTGNGGTRPMGNAITFNALYGMTWQEFVNSSYNNNSVHKIIISGNYVKMKETGGEYYVFKQATGSNSMPAALKTDTISNGFNYIIDLMNTAKPNN